MCHRYRTCAAILLGLVVSAAAHADNPPGWHLLWGDEFDGEAIDAARWNVMDAGLVKNNELQYYSPDDAFLRDGSLVLRAQRRLLGGRDYTSGHIDSKGHFALAFGRVEFRAKMAKGQGLWPAVWMLPTDSTWPPE
ncbi:MAG TPA: glycoside hydrolase family 16 protein, partial [Kiritimatiellia bacterium]